MFLAELVLLVSLSVSGTWAQEMAHCHSGYDWNHNSLGEDPCTVGSKLDASCRAVATYNYPLLGAGEYYLPPREDYPGDLNCDCNTVMYILYMACASCQGTGSLAHSWPWWIVACQSIYVSQYPKSIPQGTAVPRWAFFNVTSSPDQTYDQAALMSVGRDPEETPAGLPTTISTAPPASTSDSRSVAGGGTNVGAIVGGVFGSVVPLTIIAVVVFFCVRRRRQQQAQSHMLNQDGQRPLSTHESPTAPVPLIPYNPSDPSTFPPGSLRSSVTYVTPTHTTSAHATPIHTHRHSTYTYTGVPEV